MIDYSTLEVIDVTAIVAGMEHKLSNDSGLWLEDFDGVDLPKIDVFEARGPLQHGSTLFAGVFLPRNFTLYLGIHGTTLTELSERRHLLIDIFQFSQDGLISLRFDVPGMGARQIDCTYRRDLVFSELRGFYYQRVGVPLHAPDARFYDPVMRPVVFGIGGGDDPMVVPMNIPTPLGRSTINEVRTIAYAGTAREWPVIMLRGPMAQVAIANETTGARLAFVPGTVIGTGETYTIDCRPQAKTVRDQDGVLRNNALMLGSKLDSFYFKPRRGMLGGENDIRVTAGGLTAQSEIYVQYHDRYVGW